MTDPATVQVPPYFPDTPVVRRDIAQQYDNISKMDAQAGAILAQLEEDGLTDNTIVFFWSDQGMVCRVIKGGCMTLDCMFH